MSKSDMEKELLADDANDILFRNYMSFIVQFSFDHLINKNAEEFKQAIIDLNNYILTPRDSETNKK